MSDTRRVRSDIKHDEFDMSETAVAEARGMLEVLTMRRHRGPTDTWTAARDRTARDIGLAPAQAQRLWQRWETMKDVSGIVYRAIRNAYDAECLKHERAAEHYRSLREGTLHGREIDQEPAFAGVGVAALEDQQARPWTSA